MAGRRPWHTHLRHLVQHAFYRTLGRFFGQRRCGKRIDPGSIGSILIVRINYRIGNMLFLTPLLSELQRHLPAAKVDLLIGSAVTGTLFEGFGNVGEVHDFPRKLLKNPFRLFGHIARLRSRKYDLVIHISPSSGSNRLAAMLANSDRKISFCIEESYSPANYCIGHDRSITHEALKPLQLLTLLGITPDYRTPLSLPLGDDEKKEAAGLLEELVGERSGRMLRIGFFRDARYDKKIDDAWWRELLDALGSRRGDIRFIDILSPDIPCPLDAQTLHFQESDLRRLGAFFSQLDAFVCGDTGPMHLASASGVPTIALFKTTAPESYGTLGRHDLSLSIGHRKPGEIAGEILKHLENIDRETQAHG